MDMQVSLRAVRPDDIAACADIWNEVLQQGVAFPGEQPMNEQQMAAYLGEKHAVTCAVSHEQKVLGFYTIRANNIGRCSHVANASYCVASAARGKGIGTLLVPASLREAKALGFRGMQYNAVVKGNVYAIRLYQNNGFHIVGTIPGGFRLLDGTYSDMYILYRDLVEYEL